MSAIRTVTTTDDDVPIRPASTVMLVRDASDGAEVLMLQRTAGAAFGAGMYVFPGGRVDPADSGPDVEVCCHGHDDRSASARLGIERGGLAYWIAAVRECFEEAGVLLAERSDGGRHEPHPDDRHAVHDGNVSMAELCRRDDLRIQLADIHYVDHWVTPRGEARRFDTRFFVAAAPAEQTAAHDNSETVDSRWVTPAAALALQEAGELVMMPPTIANLRFLDDHRSVGDILSAAAEKDRPPRTEPKLRRDAGGAVVGVAMPGDDDYDALD
ncbi:MAG: NUDIX hydrolase [Actinomycetota bacterium]